MGRETALLRLLKLVLQECSSSLGPLEHLERDAGDCDEQDERECRQSGNRRLAPAPAHDSLIPPRTTTSDLAVFAKRQQVISHQVSRRIAPRRILVDRLQDDRLEISGNFRIDRAGCRRLHVLNEVHELSRARALKRRRERDQLIKGKSERINVPLGNRLLLEPLGRDEAQRADDISARNVFSIRFVGQTEIGDPDSSLEVDQQIGRLDIAVQHAIRMRIRQRPGCLFADPRDALVKSHAGRNGQT